ncbi:DUF6541 domain-containing protein [Helcobacillus massiliensis]
MQWLPLLPWALVFAVLLYLPGGVALLLMRTSLTRAVAGAPLITAVMLGVGGVVAQRWGIRYGVLTYLLLTLALWLGAYAARRAATLRSEVRSGQAQGSSAVRPRWGRGEAAGLIALMAVAVTFLWLPVVLTVDPTLPNPRVDPMYHYNVLDAIGETGTVSMFAAVDFMYGIQVRHVTYPTIWHALTVLGIPAIGVVEAAHVVSYLLIPIVFAVNSALLVRVVFRGRRWAMHIGVLAAALFPAFPAGMAYTKSFWPNALAVSFLPGLLVILLLFLRESRWGRLRRAPGSLVLSGLILIACTGGLGMTHPSVFFSFLVIALPLVVAVIARSSRTFRRALSRRALTLTAIGGAVIVLGGAALLLAPAQVRSFLLRDSIAGWNDVLLKVVSILANWPTDLTKPQGVLSAAVYLPLILFGVALLARRPGARWVGVAWLLQTLILLGAYFPLPVLSAVSGLWYSDTFRLMAVQVTILPLAVAAVFFWALDRRGEREPVAGSWGTRLPRLWAGGTVAAALVGSAYISSVSASMVGSGDTQDRPLTGYDEAALLDRLGRDLPEGSVVIGDPATGIAYLPLNSDVDSVFTQMNVREVDRDGIFLKDNFGYIRQDPRVCQLLRHYGIQYFYEDEPISYNESEREEAMPGFYGVDTSDGFTLIDQSGSAKLWRIDVCGEIDPPMQWWSRTDRAVPQVDRVEGVSGRPSTASID